MDPRLTRRIRKIFAPFRRNGLKKKFTIFSNNCWGGRVYDKFSLVYTTPTIGLAMAPCDFVKFVNDYEKYCCEVIVPNNDKQIKINNEHGHYFACLGDLDIDFIHYRDVEDAIEKWNRRKNRIVSDNIIVKMTYITRENLENDDVLEEFSKIKYKKILFTNRMELLNRDDLGIVIVPKNLNNYYLDDKNPKKIFYVFNNEFSVFDKKLKLKDIKKLINS